MLANMWQGEFPWQNLKVNGFEGTSPVDAFPASGFGLHDMAGNVWEWTCDFFTRRHLVEVAKRVVPPQPVRRFAGAEHYGWPARRSHSA
jgi:formylglycine-generating enzyme required for sulfatase activity